MIKNLLLRARARFSEELPADAESLERYSHSLLEIYNLPDKPDYHHAIATAIQQVTQGEHRVPKYSVYSFVKRAAAMRAAFHRIQSLNQAATPKKEPLLDGREATKGITEPLVPKT